MERISAQSVLVVAPGCPAELILELVKARLLPGHQTFKVLLPPESTRQYVLLADSRSLSGKVCPSPARRFFSPDHLKWLRGYLRSSENARVLIPQSPYQDAASAMVCLAAMLLSGKSITILRPGPETVFDNPDSTIGQPGENCRGSSANWLTIELNPEVLAKELGKFAWSSYPGFIKRFINNMERRFCYYFNAYDNDPVNFQPLDASPEGLQRDVDYSLLVSDSYLNKLPDTIQSIQGKTVLEIGPGINFGPILTLACHGARALVADRFLTPWDPDYHQKFYALLRGKLKDRKPRMDLTPLDLVLSQGGYPPESIALHSCSLEELSEIPDQSIDIVISNAVFEHLYDLTSAFSHLARLTKPGGLGLHQVDFRDHRDFSRPLEFLLLSEKEFSRTFAEKHGECGNRVRPQEMRQLLEQVGFAVKEFRPNQFTTEQYLTEFLGRLRQARKSKYRNYPAEDLRYLGGFFVLVKKDL